MQTAVKTASQWLYLTRPVFQPINLLKGPLDYKYLCNGISPAMREWVVTLKDRRDANLAYIAYDGLT